jgi:C4-dicarboxylate transporter DctM subunit
MTMILILLLFFILVLIGVPIAFSFGLVTITFLFITVPDNAIIIASRGFGSVDSFALMAIPLFILAGDVMKEGDISRNLISFVNLFVAKIKAPFSHVTVIASAFFGAISGSAAATVAAIGGIMIPEMTKKGYGREKAVAVAAAAGCLGVLIPPSIPLIIYGLMAQVSIAKLFLGGIVPGILLSVAFMIVNKFMFKDVKSDAETSSDQETTYTNRPSSATVFMKAIPALIMPLIILGGIYSGVFTPTESGAAAALYGILVSMLVYRSMGVKKLMAVSGNSAMTSAVILIIISMAGVFGWLITTEQVPAMVAEAVTSLTTNPVIILLFLNIFYLIVGTFMETVTAIVITTPIFLPLIQIAEIDLVHFGIIQTVNLCIGLLTPPMSLNLLIASKIGGTTIIEPIRALLPYLAVSILVLLLVTYVPQVSLFLPNLLLK